MSAYPPALRSVLKAAPSVLWLFTSTVVFGTVLYNLISHPNDHAPRMNFRTHRFERALRYRDDSMRHDFQKLLTFNPNVNKLVD